MQRDKKLIGKSAATPVARPRRLGVEKLELRSVLATLVGTPVTLQLLPEGVDDFVSLTAVRQGEPPVMGPGEIAHFGFLSTSSEPVQLSHAPSLTPMFFQIADPESWGDLREINLGNVRIIDSLPLDSVLIDTIWQIRPGNIWPILQKPWLDRLPEIEVEIDPRPDRPWSGEDSKPNDTTNNHSDDSPTHDPGSGPLDTAPNPVTPAPRPDWDLTGSENDRELFPWLDLIDASPTISRSSQETALPLAAPLRDGSSTLTAVTDPEYQDEGNLDFESERQQTKSDDFSTGLLELPPARLFRTTPFVPAEMYGPSAATAARQYGNNSQYSGVAPVQSGDGIPNLTHDFGTEGPSANYDEGGLVELFVVANIQKSPLGRMPVAVPVNSSLIDAEIGLIQAIDVAASLTAEPTYAAMYPVFLITAFHLFDQRRKLRDLESENLPGGRVLWETWDG